jgi:hypothetical protein
LALGPERGAAAAAPACACCDAPIVPTTGAVLRVRRSGEGLAWDGRYFVDVGALADMPHIGETPGPLRLAFAVPLPPGTTSDLPALGANGRTTGLCVERALLEDGVLRVSFVEPPPVAEVGAPVAAGAAVQIVEAGDPADTAIEPTGRGLVRHVGFFAPEAVGHPAREDALRLAERRGIPVESPIFVRGEDVAAGGGLAGHVVDPRARTRGSAAGVAAVFAAIVAALALAAKRLRSRASVERADALLASEIAEVARGRPE